MGIVNNYKRKVRGSLRRFNIENLKKISSNKISLYAWLWQNRACVC